MVVDFSAIRYDEPPVLVLKNLDGTPIQPLMYAHDINAHLCYNEISELSFDLPAEVDGIKTPHYDDVVGMRIIDWMGIGQFILVNPEREHDGIREMKHCQAYSLEYEFNYKKIFMTDGTYNFWNPASTDGTVLGIILESMPSWSVGTVDPALVGKYRTFSADDQTIYDFMKGSLQDTYQCIFDFDTYQRKINVRSVESLVSVNPVYLSTDNLIKEIKIAEDTDNIYTCLDVNGADGVDIRSVNPTGSNKIYNLDYFMNESYFSSEMIDKWNMWKAKYEESRQAYYNLTVEKVLMEASIEAENALLTEMQNQLDQDETLRSTYVEAAGQGIDKSADLAEIKQKISDQESAINDQKDLIDGMRAEIDAMYERQKAINAECSLSAFFGDEDLKLLDRYMKEDSISEESFVYRTVSSYSDQSFAKELTSTSLSVSGSKITMVTTDSGKVLYTIIGGRLEAVADGETISGDMIRGSVESQGDGSFIFSAYLNKGTTAENGFVSGCIHMSGTMEGFSSDVEPSDDVGSSYLEGTSLSFSSSGAHLYFSYNVTEYAKRAVEWDLFEYGEQCLRDLCWPSYTFSVDSANFLACEDFLAFKNQLSLGEKVYLNIDEKIMTPIVIGAEFNMHDPTSFSLEFGDKYSSSDSAFKLVNLLDESISMGKTVSTNRVSYAAFKDGNYANKVDDLINDALDVSKNKILSSDGQSMDWGPYGMRFRKELDDAPGTYDLHQMWAINSGLYLTENGWDSVKLAIGQIGDDYGIVADNIYGRLVAANNLVIESNKQSNGTSIFRVDGEGAKLYNADLDLVSNYSVDNASYVGQIGLHPTVGLTVGNTSSENSYFSYDEQGNISGIKTANGSSLLNISELSDGDVPLANFWCDMYGNVYLKGTVVATDGEFSGTIHANGGDFKGTVNATDLQLDGVSISNIFSATPDETGALDYLQIGNITIDGTTGEITFAGGGDIVQVRYSTSKIGPWQTEWDTSWTDIVVYAQYSYDGGTTWGSPMQIQSKNGLDGENGSDANVPNYIKSTYIKPTEIRSPEIRGNNMSVYGAFKVLNGSDDLQGYMGYAEGQDIDGNTTYGVALATAGTASGDSETGITYATGGYYLIVTNAGVRMQAPGHELTVTKNGAFYDGTEIGTGSGTAVFG